MSNLSLSVVLVTHNTRELTLSCLESIYTAAQEEGWQMIVVDNGSIDGTVDAIVEAFPAVEVIASENNLGYAGGNNLGLKRSRGDAIILLNSDVVADPTVLLCLADYLHTHGDVGAVSPQLLTKQGAAQSYAFGNDPTITYLVRRGLNGLLRRGDLHDWAVDQAIDVEWISGACFCLRRSVMDEIGLLDDGFFLYFEDNDWCLRMRKAGWRIVYHPSWSVVHLGGGSQPERRGSNPLYYESLLHFYEKHYDWWQTQILSLAIAIYRQLIAHSDD